MMNRITDWRFWVISLLGFALAIFVQKTVEEGRAEIRRQIDERDRKQVKNRENKKDQENKKDSDKKS